MGQPLDRVAVDRDARKVRDGGGRARSGDGCRPAPRRSPRPRPRPRRPSRRWPGRSPGRRAGPAPGRRPRAASAAAPHVAPAAPPTPGGPPILWALTLIRSAPRSVKATGRWPAAWAASTCCEHASVATLGHDLGHRLQGADLVVAPLEVDERRVGADRIDHLGGVDVAEGNRSRPRSPRAVRMPAAPQVLDGRDDDVVAPLGRAEDRVAAMASVAPLVELTSRAGSDQRRDLVSRRLDRDPAGVTLGMDAATGPRRRPSAARPPWPHASRRSGEVEAWSR